MLFQLTWRKNAEVYELTSQKLQNPRNYQEWLENCFGTTFSRFYPEKYTEKYWTVSPKDLTTDWIGPRIPTPDYKSMLSGFVSNRECRPSYITSIRYPSSGGFETFFKPLSKGANIKKAEVVAVDLKQRSLVMSDKSEYHYGSLINTIPLPEFCRLIKGIPDEIIRAAEKLSCTSSLLVNITGRTKNKIPYHWFYIYDREMLSTRVTQTHLLAENNVSKSLTGIQVEVYESKYKPFKMTHEEIAQRVCREMQKIGAINEIKSLHYQYISYANIIYDHPRRQAQNLIFEYLSDHGLARESSDLDPLTKWDTCETPPHDKQLYLAGRYGQWKYYWTDDCILRGKAIAEVLA